MPRSVPAEPMLASLAAEKLQAELGRSGCLRGVCGRPDRRAQCLGLSWSGDFISVTEPPHQWVPAACVWQYYTSSNSLVLAGKALSPVEVLEEKGVWNKWENKTHTTNFQFRHVISESRGRFSQPARPTAMPEGGFSQREVAFTKVGNSLPLIQQGRQETPGFSGSVLPDVPNLPR